MPVFFHLPIYPCIVAPTIIVRHETFYASFGQRIVLECITESHPMSDNYWVHGKDLVTGGTYESITMENVYKVIMRYVAVINDSNSFGAYKCVAKNSIGEAERVLHIHRKLADM